MLDRKPSFSLVLVSICIVFSQKAIGGDSCTDISDNCQWNMARGECTSNSFVQHRCRKSCDLCGDNPPGLLCDDIGGQSCMYQQGQCMYSIHVMYNCMKTCGLCVDTAGLCADIDGQCSSKKHYCPKSSNPTAVYHQFRCQKTCESCEAGATGPAQPGGEASTEEGGAAAVSGDGMSGMMSMLQKMMEMMQKMQG